jgi:Homeodomain-like domain
MPSGILAETRRLLAAAAALRVAGASWEAVAERLGRSIRTCRNWPTRSKYRSVWRELYAAAEKEYKEEIANEARCVLRGQLRNENDKDKRDAAKAARDAAKAILAHADRNRPSNSKDDPPSAWQFAESIPEPEAHQLKVDTDGILGPDTTGGANGASGRALPG